MLIGITRKLKDICHSLTIPVEQWKATEFLANSGNAQRVNSLVEGIHEALMEYQVCILNWSLSTMSNTHARLQYNRISIIRVARPL